MDIRTVDTEPDVDEQPKKSLGLQSPNQSKQQLYRVRVGSQLASCIT